MNYDSLKIVSVNVEGDKHLNKILPFLNSENPDVVCIQEALDKDVQLFKDTLQMSGKYFPTVKMPEGNRGDITPHTRWGILVLFKQPPLTVISDYYVHHGEDLPTFDNEDVNSTNRVLVGVEYKKNGILYRIFTTHFTWTPNGEPNQLQSDNLHDMMKVLDQYDDLILCGDFNAPRGKEIWDFLANKFIDNIPQNITTTIDQNLHKVKGIQFVVDGLFSTPHYSVEDVQVVDGISDHMAIVATIKKISE